MKALILAAGQTKTEDPYNFPENYKPKCLLEYENEVILEKNVKLLRKHGINDIIVVIGYKASEVKEFARERNLELNFVHNPDFSDKASIDSLLLGMEEVPPDETFLLFLGDIIVSEELLENLLKSDSELCAKTRAREELFAAKISIKALGNLSQMREEVLRNSQRDLTLALGFCEYLLKRGAEEVDGELVEVDSIIDLR